MNRCAVLAIIFVMLLFTGCATVQVSQDYRSGTNFSRYHAYQWKAMAEPDPADVETNNPLLHDRFHQAIDRMLGLRGYTQDTPADFLVSYTYTIQTRLESDPYGTNVGFGYGRHSRYSQLGFGDYGDIRQYNVGILAIDFYDALSGELMWRGVGSDRVGIHWTPEETTAFVTQMVDAVLAQFPPR